MSCQFSAPVSSMLAEAAFIEALSSVIRNSPVGLHQDLCIGQQQSLTLLTAFFVFLTKVSMNRPYLEMIHGSLCYHFRAMEGALHLF